MPDSHLKNGLPSSPEAEQAILGGILLENRLAGEADKLVQEADMHFVSNRLIYSAMLYLWKEGIRIDVVTLSSELRKRGEFERVGGYTYLSSLIDGVPHTDTIEYYARSVKEEAKKRKLLALSEQIESQVYEGLNALEIGENVRRSLDSLELKPEKSRLIHADELDNEPPIEWLIENEISANSLIVLFGASEAGKSFVALDYSLRISQTQPVVYIAAEGGQGYGKRKRAWCEYHKRDSGNLYFWPEPVSLLCVQAVDELMREVRELKPALVVFDTLARCLLGGDENSAKDMGLAIDAMGQIQQQTGASILVVHHTGKSGSLERGSSALRAASDSMIELTNDDGLIQLQCSKAKDSERFKPRYLRLVKHGESCVPLPADKVDGQQVRLSIHERRILETLSLPCFSEVGAGYKELQKESGVPKGSFHRTVEPMKEKGLLTQKGNRGEYLITEAGRAAIETIHYELSPDLDSANPSYKNGLEDRVISVIS